MGSATPSKVLIFGDRLYSGGWEKACSRKYNLPKAVSVYTVPTIPDIDCSGGTAYIDLEDSDFRQPEFLQQLSESFDKLQIIGITDSPSQHQATEISKSGVSEVLSKKQYESHVTSLLSESKSEAAPHVLPANRFGVSSIIGRSSAISEIKKMVEHLGDVDYPNAIIFGETGTGKDLLAKVMHYTGIREDGHFIEVNCSAIPDELFESELFGHTKGAFTDAKSDKTGLFEFADNGTIFLDEVGNLSQSAQAKLLKILESRKLRPLGAVEEKDINVRVVAATNIDLYEAVAHGRFREDLLFRLNLIAIHLPPLRERKEDIPELAAHSFDFYRNLYSKPLLSITDDALQKLLEHEWPGNVRELRNVIERAVLLSTSDRITIKQIGGAVGNGRVTAKERRSITIDIPIQGISLKSIEKQVIAEILNIVDWNRSEVARILGISRGRLRRIMEENNLQADRRGSGHPGSE